jgi:hypothetical protein
MHAERSNEAGDQSLRIEEGVSSTETEVVQAANARLLAVLSLSLDQAKISRRQQKEQGQW